MKLIFAQGNPGQQYIATRHNVGFMALDSFAESLSVPFSDKPKLKAQIAEGQVNGEKVLLAKPTTFYNETGQSARAIVDFYKFDPANDVLVIHDDIALPFGTLRVRDKGSDAGNNGIKSLNSHIGPDYWRLRIGIYSELRDRMHDADFVLGKFNSAEKKVLEAVILPHIKNVIDDFINKKAEASSLKIDIAQEP